MGVALIIGIILIALIGAVIVAFYLVEPRRQRLEEREREQENRADELRDAQRTLNAQLQDLSAEKDTVTRHRQELESIVTRNKAVRAELENKLVSYKEMVDENAILKRDLRNLDLNVRKLNLDERARRQVQAALDEKTNELGTIYLRENVKWLSSSLNPNNFASCKQRLLTVIERCRAIHLVISPEEETTLLTRLREEYEKVVRAAFQREEQARIKAQIREEQMREREIDRELKQLEREREAISAALQKALAEATDLHSEEVEKLKARLADAEARTARAISQAQLTKSGHVYVISNIGSFGADVIKVGLTRRLDPTERVDELGSASVPFPFDVHMMISSNDAPALENQIHRRLHHLRINKANPRKEFFKVSIETISQIVKELHGEVQFIADAEALEYRQSQSMSMEDQEFIEQIYDKLEDESPDRT